MSRAKFFGAWTTAFGPEPNAKLSTYWQRRMAMLPNMKQQNAGISRRLRGLLAAGALAVLALSNLFIVQVKAAEEKPAAAVAGETRPDEATHEAAGRVEFLPRIAKAEEKILKALDSPAEIDMVEMPFNQAIAMLQDNHAIEIQLDDKNAEDAGISADTPITRRVRGITLRSALNLILNDLELAAVVRDDVLFITTKDIAKSPDFCLTRTYPVGDLIVGNDYGDLQAAITATVSPQTWDDVAGSGSIAIVPTAKSLVISQSRAQHDEIVQLLRALRAARALPSGK